MGLGVYGKVDEVHHEVLKYYPGRATKAACCVASAALAPVAAADARMYTLGRTQADTRVPCIPHVLTLPSCHCVVVSLYLALPR